METAQNESSNPLAETHSSHNPPTSCVVDDIDDVVHKSFSVEGNYKIKRKVEARLSDSEEEDDRNRKRKRKSKDRERSSERDRSKERGRDRHRDQRDRDRSRERRHRDRERDKDKERDRSDRDRSDRDRKEQRRDSDRKDAGENTTDKDKERDRDSLRERERGRDRDRRRTSYSRSRSARRRRERERDRERDRERNRRSSRERNRDRERRRGDDSRSREREYSSRDKERDFKDKGSSNPAGSVASTNDNFNNNNGVNINSAKPVTLKDVIAANPGISMPEAVVRLNAYNSAIARGEAPPPLSASAQILRTMIAPPIMTMNNPLQNPLLPANLLTSLQTQNPQDIASKPHREVYVGNLPPGITVPQLAEFLNTALRHIGAIPPPGESSSYTAVITAWISPDGHYGFVELRTMEQANIALQQLNGIQVGIHQLKLGRPKGYNPNSNITSVAVPMSNTSLPLGAPLGASVATGVGGIGAANPLLAGLGLLQGGANPDLQQSRVVMVANLPVLITEAQIVDLFGSFGSFKAFNLIPVPLSSGSAGATQSAVFEYDSTVSLDIIDSVISGMNGLDLGGNKITVSRVPLSSAAILLKPKAASTETATFNSVPAQAVDNSTQKPVHAAFLEEEQLKSHLHSPTRILRLSNMTNPEEDFADEQMYQELIEDVESECNKYGAVQRVVIPRELTPAHPAYGVIFVSFAHASGAQAARDKIQGRKFNGQVVQAMYFPEVLFAENTFALPIDYRFDNATVNENEQHHPSLRETKNSETSSMRLATAADELD